MSLFEFEFLKFKNDRFSYALFLLFLIFSFFIGILINNPNLMNYNISIAIVDNENNEFSKKYIDNLNSNDLIEVIEIKSEKEIDRMLKNSIIETALIIPKGYFKDILNNKITLKYLSYNPVAPAMLDLYSKDLMIPIAKSKLFNIVEINMDEKSASTAVKRFDKVRKENDFNLYTSMQEKGRYLGLKAEYKSKIIEFGRTILGFMVSTISIIFSLSYAIRKDKKNIYRMLSISNFFIKQYIVSRIYDYSKLIVLASVITYNIVSNVGFKLESSIYIVAFAALIPVLYYELFSIIYNLKLPEHISNLLCIGTILLSSIFGGAYFPTDLLPKTYQKLISFIPFYQLNKLYYNAISNYNEKRTMIFTITVLIIVLTSVSNYYLSRKNSI